MKQTQADREMIAEMQGLLEQESRKPADKRDYDLIAQLAAIIYEATSADDLSEKSISLTTMQSTEKSRKLHQNRWIRLAVSLAVCAILCIGANAWTLHVFGTSLTDMIYQVTKGGISFHPADLDHSIIELETSADDPYGIRTECEKFGFSPLTPAYLPENMNLYMLNEFDDKTQYLSLTYRETKKSKKHIMLSYEYAEEQNIYENINFGFPCDDYNIHEKEIGEKTVLISWEDEVFHAIFCDDEKHIIYHISSNHIGYDESYRILCSYFD